MASTRFGAAAVDSAMQWRYEPELVNGKAVPFIVTASVAFRP
jgi:hypothetical protein